MSSPVQKIDGEKTVLEASKLMVEKKIGSLIVSNYGSLGIITERDIVRAVATNSINEKVHSLASNELITIHKEKPLGMAAQLMLTKKIRRLAVIDDNKEVVGLINIRDVLSAVHDAFLAIFEA